MERTKVTLAELILHHRLVVRPSMIPGQYIAAQLRGTSLVGDVIRVWPETTGEGKTLEDAVIACLAKLWNREKAADDWAAKWRQVVADTEKYISRT